MSKKTPPKSRRRPNYNYTTVRICGKLVSNRYNLVCGLPPHVPHTKHAALTLADDDPYLVVANPQNKQVLIQLEDGSWHDVEDQNPSQLSIDDL